MTCQASRLGFIRTTSSMEMPSHWLTGMSRGPLAGEARQFAHLAPDRLDLGAGGALPSDHADEDIAAPVDGAGEGRD